MGKVKEGNTSDSAFFRGLFRTEVYKRSQGRVARQVTFAALVIMLALGAWSLKSYLAVNYSLTVQYVFAGALLLVGTWLCFRVVNMPRFADFLIAVEAEMNKVSWPSRSELFRSSLVVIITIFGLAAVLFAYDFFWQMLLSALGVLGAGGG